MHAVATSRPAGQHRAVPAGPLARWRRGALHGIAAVTESFVLVVRAAPVLAGVMLLLQIADSASHAILLLLVGEVVSGNSGGSLAVIAVVILVAAVGQTLQNGLRLLLADKVSFHTENLVLDGATAADGEMFDDPEFHEMLSRARSSVGRPSILTQALLGFVASTSLALGLAGVVLTLHPLLLPALIAVCVPLLLVTMRFSQKVHRFATEHNGSVQRRLYLNGLMLSRGPSVEIRAYGLTHYLRSTADWLYRRRAAGLRVLVGRGAYWFVGASTLSAGVLVACIGWLGLRSTAGALDAAAAAVGAITVIQFTAAVSGAALSAGRLYESALFIDDLRAFRSLTRGSARSGRPGAGPTVPAPVDVGCISVENVTFSYPGADEPTLKRVSMTLRRGEVVALVGANGSGKTTLAKLLCRHYLPTRGRICWDGADTAAMDPDTLRDAIGVLFQDYGKYLFTAADNIGIGRVDDITDRDGITRAAARANAAPFIKALPKGYDSQLGSVFGGSDLSGGQWQRVAFARAFFRGSPLVILDEPTAALDPHAEHMLMKRMRDLFAGRTILLISHRLTSLTFADRINVLDAGRITECGSHAELMELGGTYAELYRLQSRTQKAAGPVVPPGSALASSVARR